MKAAYVVAVKAMIDLAKVHQHRGEMSSSAIVCVKDAEYLVSIGRIDDAKNRAMQSIRYSLGEFSPIYQQIKRQFSTDAV